MARTRKYFDENGNRITQEERKARIQAYIDKMLEKWQGFLYCELWPWTPAHRTPVRISYDVDRLASNRAHTHHISGGTFRADHESNYILCCRECHLLTEGKHQAAYEKLCLSIKAKETE